MDAGARKDSIALINGVIYPMAPPGRASALFARGGVIAALGTDAEILGMCDARTTVLDMKGKFVFPGFTDTHCHLLEAGRSLETLGLKGTRSIDEMIERSKEFLQQANLSNDEWFFARGWDQNYFSDNRFPNRHDLDQISKEKPLMFERYCGHIAVLNSKALKLLDVTPKLKIAGGVVYLDEKGKPNGLVSEAAVNWVRTNIPAFSDETLARWYKRATDEMVKYGVTAAQTDDIEMAGGTERLFALYERMEAENKMPLRVTEQWHIRDEAELSAFIERGDHLRGGEAYFKSGPLKIHVDGTLGARTAALREEYSDDPGNRGIYAHSQSELDSLVRIAHKAKMNVAFYAIGDGAIERCLNSVSANGGVLSDRIVHCQVGARDLYERMESLGVMADIQPAFVTSDWPIVMQRLGAERARWSHAWKTLDTFGITVGAGSDAPTESLNPFVGIRAAVTRQDMENMPPHGWMPAERMDKVEALSLYTVGGAKVCGEFGWRGTLEVGKAADIVAFMQNPFQLEPDELPDIEVGLTVVDGKIRYIA